MNVIKVTVDAVIVREGKILFIVRKNDPFSGCLALPGGFVEYGETTEEAVKREVKEETGLTGEVKKLVGVYSAPGRDPRGHTISVVYLVEAKGEVHAADDAREAVWVPLDEIQASIMAFDHAAIVEDALKLL